MAGNGRGKRRNGEWQGRGSEGEWVSGLAVSSQQLGRQTGWLGSGGTGDKQALIQVANTGKIYQSFQKEQRSVAVVDLLQSR